jgi:DNA-binding XRE family transcriptional regulator
MNCLIGEYIEKSGFKKGHIADQLGVTRQQLSNWIGGRSHPPIMKAFQLAKLLGCKVDDLYEEEKDK